MLHVPRKRPAKLFWELRSGGISGDPQSNNHVRAGVIHSGDGCALLHAAVRSCIVSSQIGHIIGRVKGRQLVKRDIAAAHSVLVNGSRTDNRRTPSPSLPAGRNRNGRVVHLIVRVPDDDVVLIAREASPRGRCILSFSGRVGRPVCDFHGVRLQLRDSVCGHSIDLKSALGGQQLDRNGGSSLRQGGIRDAAVKNLSKVAEGYNDLFLLNKDDLALAVQVEGIVILAQICGAQGKAVIGGNIVLAVDGVDGVLTGLDVRR